jgi:hypothetical protein
MSPKRVETIKALFVVALVFSFFRSCARIDSPEELESIKIMDWIAFGPLWGLLAFIWLDHAFRNRPKGRALAIITAVATWFILAFMANWLLNLEMRR